MKSGHTDRWADPERFKATTGVSVQPQDTRGLAALAETEPRRHERLKDDLSAVLAETVPRGSLLQFRRASLSTKSDHTV